MFAAEVRYKKRWPDEQDWVKGWDDFWSDTERDLPSRYREGYADAEAELRWLESAGLLER